MKEKSDKMKKIQNIVVASILSFGLIISAALITNAMYNNSKLYDEITVKGVAEKVISADTGIISVNYFVTDVSYEDAYNHYTEKKNDLISLLNDLSINSSNYDIGGLLINPIFIENTNEVREYNLSQTVNISVSKNEAKSVYESISELKLKYNNFVVQEPIYFIDNYERYKSDLLVSATRNAENRANEILKNSNSKIGDLKKIVQGSFEIINNNNVENIGKTVDQQSNKKLRVVVTATYSIQKLK